MLIPILYMILHEFFLIIFMIQLFLWITSRHLTLELSGGGAVRLERIVYALYGHELMR